MLKTFTTIKKASAPAAAAAALKCQNIAMIKAIRSCQPAQLETMLAARPSLSKSRLNVLVEVAHATLDCATSNMITHGSLRAGVSGLLLLDAATFGMSPMPAPFLAVPIVYWAGRQYMDIATMHQAEETCDLLALRDAE